MNQTSGGPPSPAQDISLYSTHVFDQDDQNYDFKLAQGSGFFSTSPVNVLLDFPHVIDLDAQLYDKDVVDESWSSRFTTENLDRFLNQAASQAS
jgi:hypothetical protein